MTEAPVAKIDAGQAPTGPQGQRYLAHTDALSMRLWDAVQPGHASDAVRRDYETVGYVIAGRAELTIEGRSVMLEPGSSWIVPKGAEHGYRIHEPFTAVEATHPPAELQHRDTVPKN